MVARILREFNEALVVLGELMNLKYVEGLEKLRFLCLGVVRVTIASHIFIGKGVERDIIVVSGDF